MTNILYEAQVETGFDFDFIEILLFLAVIALYPLATNIFSKKKRESMNFKVTILFSVFAFLFVLIVGSIAFLGQSSMSAYVFDEYQKGKAKVVEGYVENFDPMPYDGHKYESFSIDNLTFFYSDFAEQPGYHTAKSHGGVIKGNGQHLRITYVYYDEAYGNIIMRIEELP